MMIYADYNATSPLLPEVKNYLLGRLASGPFANPSSLHKWGKTVALAQEKSRDYCSSFLGAQRQQIIFTSGATEGINTIFHSVLSSSNKSVVLISDQEHAAVEETALFWESKGKKILTIQTKSDGKVDLQHLATLLQTYKNQVAIVCVIMANNETGIIQDIHQAKILSQDAGAVFFSDTTQWIGKRPFDFQKWDLDFAVVSGHKLGALSGSGLLLVKNFKEFCPLIHGGGQEAGLRGGTPNYIAQETLPYALDVLGRSWSYLEDQLYKKEQFESQLLEKIPNAVIIGRDVERLENTTYIAFPQINAQIIQIELESLGISVTTSSACSDNEILPSKSAKAMKLDDALSRGAIRISFGHNVPLETYEKIRDALVYVVGKLSKIRV